MTARLEEANAELKEAAERKLVDAKAELKEAEQKLNEAEAKVEQVEEKLAETKQADPADAAEIQRLEQKLHTLNGDVAVRRRAFYSKSASVESKEEVVRRLESHLPVTASTALASAEGGTNMQQDKSRDTTDTVFITALSLPLLAASVSL